MTRFGRLLLVAMVFLAPAWSRAQAQKVQGREFNILVDGKKVGVYQMAVGEHPGGVVTMGAKASVTVKKLGVTVYSYSYSGSEIYRDGRLISFKSNTNDHGKVYAVVGEAKGEGFSVKVNNEERNTNAGVWPTSYWKLPPGKYRNGAVPLLDADTGKDINGKLQYVGAEQMNVAGKMENCTHYRVTGGPSPIDLWFDSQERLVRQDYLEEGHRTIFELYSIR